MAKTANKPGKAPGTSIFSANEFNAGVDQAMAAGIAEGKAQGLLEGAALERTRVAAILNSSEATSRAELANHLAFRSDVSAEAARDLLATSPKEPVPNALAVIMAQVKNPDVGVGGFGDSMTDDQKAAAMSAEIMSAEIVGTYRMAHPKV